MSNLRVMWCQLMHDDIAYGGGRFYWCRRCLHRFSVPWLPASGVKQQAARLTAAKEPSFAAGKVA